MNTLLGSAWNVLCSSGTASPVVARVVNVALQPVEDALVARYLGPAGSGSGLKCLLGGNGEGKSHALYRVHDAALGHDHVSAFVEATVLGASSLGLAQAVLRAALCRETAALEDEAYLPALFEAAVARKRKALEDEGLDPEVLVVEWAEGFRTKNLPGWVAEAAADALRAAIAGDRALLRTCAARIGLEGRKLTKTDAEQLGNELLAALPRLVKALGFRSLVILLDEAETAVTGKSKAKREQFLMLVRFLNDHVANQPNAPAFVLVACTDDFWPKVFQGYHALYTRLVDPGRDRLEDRKNLKPAALAGLSKIWVCETFRGEETEYLTLGDALLDLAARVHPGLDREIQLANVRAFAAVASSNRVRKSVKRNFIKALCQEIELQLAGGEQRVIDRSAAEKALDAAAQAILADDAA